MRRGFGVGMALLVILIAVGVGIGAYNWGFAEGLESARAGGDVVRVIGPGGGFGFGWILFPLFFFGIFFLLRGAFWSRRWGGPGGGSWGPGHGRGEGHRGFEEWHRRQHEEQRPAETGTA
jgi:hypothetical protein